MEVRTRTRLSELCEEGVRRIPLGCVREQLSGMLALALTDKHKFEFHSTKGLSLSHTRNEMIQEPCDIEAWGRRGGVSVTVIW